MGPKGPSIYNRSVESRTPELTKDVKSLISLITKVHDTSKTIKWACKDKRTIDLKDWLAIVQAAKSLK